MTTLERMSGRSSLPDCEHMLAEDFFSEVSRQIKRFRWRGFRGGQPLSDFQIATIAKDFWVCHPPFIERSCKRCGDLGCPAEFDIPSVNAIPQTGGAIFVAEWRSYYGWLYYLFVALSMALVGCVIAGLFISLYLSLVAFALLIAMLWASPVEQYHLFSSECIGWMLTNRLRQAPDHASALKVWAHIAAAYADGRVNVWITGFAVPPGLLTNVITTQMGVIEPFEIFIPRHEGGAWLCRLHFDDDRTYPMEVPEQVEPRW